MLHHPGCLPHGNRVIFFPVALSGHGATLLHILMSPHSIIVNIPGTCGKGKGVLLSHNILMPIHVVCKMTPGIRVCPVIGVAVRVVHTTPHGVCTLLVTNPTVPSLEVTHNIVALPLLCVL